VSRDDDARAVWHSLTQLFISDDNQRRFPDIAEREDVTVRLMHAILDISPDEPISMKQLAQQWYCDASNVTSIVDGLEERGLARRDPSPTDRRVKLVGLTKAGAAMRERIVERLSDPPSVLLSLSAAELKTLRSILGKAAGRLEAPRG
jgi:DNA-binding MarR family transcriptional regulator